MDEVLPKHAERARELEVMAAMEVMESCPYKT